MRGIVTKEGETGSVKIEMKKLHPHSQLHFEFEPRQDKSYCLRCCLKPEAWVTLHTRT